MTPDSAAHEQQHSQLPDEARRRTADVLVVGAGPTGLLLASELLTAGVRAITIEARLERGPHARALGIHARTMEVLALRGLSSSFLREGVKVPAWHFGMLPNRIDLSGLPTPFPFLLAIPQTRTEELLQAHAESLGATIERGVRLVGLQELEGRLLADVEDGSGRYQIEAKYVVGCDGGRSTVRSLGGIDFPGSDADAWGFLADVEMTRPPAPGFGINTSDGAVIVANLPDGRRRVAGWMPGLSRETQLDLNAITQFTKSLLGDDFGMNSPSWISQFGNDNRLATSYRNGRVILAGDAAHVHWPTGGVGMNVGLQDAFALGWRLARVAKGQADDSLLDGYSRERHSVGEQLRELTLAQGALITAATPEQRGLRDFLNDTVKTTPQFSFNLAMTLSALNVQYSEPGKNLCVGRRIPSNSSLSTDQLDTLIALFVPAAPVLISPAGGTAAIQDFGVTTHAGLPHQILGDDWLGTRHVLVRPDGYVAWASADWQLSLEDLTEALGTLGWARSTPER